MQTLKVDLTPHQEELIENLVSSGQFSAKCCERASGCWSAKRRNTTPA